MFTVCVERLKTLQSHLEHQNLSFLQAIKCCFFEKQDCMNIECSGGASKNIWGGRIFFKPTQQRIWDKFCIDTGDFCKGWCSDGGGSSSN